MLLMLLKIIYSATFAGTLQGEGPGRGYKGT